MITVVVGKEIEKIKGEFESVINGMNMVGEIPYNVYSELFDAGTECIQKAYELGKSEIEKENGGRPKWHKISDGDLPKNSDDEKLYLVYWGENDYGVAQFNDGRWWSFDSGWYDVEEVIAWCKVSAFKKE